MGKVSVDVAADGDLVECGIKPLVYGSVFLVVFVVLGSVWLKIVETDLSVEEMSVYVAEGSGLVEGGFKSFVNWSAFLVELVVLGSV